MKFTAAQIAGLINGEVSGNPEASVSGLSKIENGKPNTLSFLANPKYEEYLYDTDATVVIVNSSFSPSKPLKDSTTLIKVEDAYACFAKLLEVYDKATAPEPGVSDLAFVDETATIGENVYIGPFAYIGKGVKIGNDAFIYPHCFIDDETTIDEGSKLYSGVKVYRASVIGKYCTLHAGVIIGADGFGFAPSAANDYKKVPQIGNVILEDHVEIGANTCVDRATLGSTVIKKGVKLDNLVQIGHNVVVGDNTVMAAQVGVAGSAKLGKNMMIGGQVGIVGHIEIADGVMIGAQSGIPKTIKKEGSMHLGSPAYDAEEYKKAYMGFRRLPMILSKMRELEEEIKSLKSKLNG